MEEVRRGPICLDALDVRTLRRRPRIIVTNERFLPIVDGVRVQYVAPPWRALRRICARIPLANPSQSASAPMPVGDYVFSGGHSERDDKTLFDAVRGLSIPVIVSATRPGSPTGWTSRRT